MDKKVYTLLSLELLAPKLFSSMTEAHTLYRRRAGFSFYLERKWKGPEASVPEHRAAEDLCCAPSFVT